MVVAAYLAGLISTPAACLGVLGGVWWWRRYRRAQRPLEPVELTPRTPPPPPDPQGSPVLNRMSGRSVPGRRRVRGRMDR